MKKAVDEVFNPKFLLLNFKDIYIFSIVLNYYTI